MAKLLAQSDPLIFLRTLPEHDKDFRRILALDLGTNTGVAFADIPPGGPREDVLFHLGQWDLSLGSWDTSVLRLARLRAFLGVVKPDLVVYEDPRYTAPTEGFAGRNISVIVARAVSGAEVIISLKVSLTDWCEVRKIPCHGIGSGQLKKSMTGKGNAGKEDMIRACNAKFGTDFDPETYDKTGVDNIADAAGLLALGLQLYSEAI